jgi:aminomethyltransferase
MNAKKTPLYDQHVKQGGHMVEFANTLLPVRYQSETEEYLAVRQAVGMFDVSHMGEFFVSGPDALEFLQDVLTNDVTKLLVGQAQYSLILNGHGGIIDDVILYRLTEGEFFLCVNAANIEKDWHHLALESKKFAQLTLTNASEQFAQIALQGPQAERVLKELVSETLPSRFTISRLAIAGHETWTARTGYTGEDGFEIFLSPIDAVEVWEALLKIGTNYGLKPCGLAARDALRLEAGYLLHGQDMDETTSPGEAGLMFAVSMHKKQFLGKDALLAEQSQGITKKLMGFSLLDRGLARHGFKVFDEHQNEIGEVTSAGFLPQTQRAIGFLYIRSDHAQYGGEVLIDIRGRFVGAKLTKMRFLTKK